MRAHSSSADILQHWKKLSSPASVRISYNSESQRTERERKKKEIETEKRKRKKKFQLLSSLGV